MGGNKVRSIAIGAALALSMLGVACSSSGSGSAPSGSGGVTLTMKDFAFSPTTLAVHSGPTTITVTNTGSVQHSFTLNDGSVDQTVQPGQTVSVTVNLSGDAGFHCRFHPTQMKGTLTVS
jgi:plastocyanin